MADNVGYTPGVGATVAADEIAGVLHQRVKIGVGADGVAVDVSATNPMPVTGTVSTGLSQPLTDTQLRATPVPVSGTVTANTGLTQPLTDTQLRASPVPVSGTVTANTGLTQPLTDAQLRATAVPVSVGSIALPTGASTLAEQQSQTTLLGTIDADTGNIASSASSIDTKTPALVSGRVPVDGSGVTQPVSIAASVAVTGPLTDAQLRATAVPVSAASLPLPAGAATLAEQQSQTALLGTIDADSGAIASSVSSIDAKTPSTSTRVVDNEASGSPVRAIGQEIWNVSFSEVGASVISSQFQTPATGTGVSYSQASGALSIVAGTTANAEFFTRSTTAWRGSMRLKFSIVASQRIANNNLAVMLADLIGEDLAVTINSATSITVSQTGHPFTSTSVGQFVQVGRIVGAAGVPGRYAIASVVAGVSYNLTVTGWPASGTCTATVFGHSYLRNLVTGTTATAINVDCQRRGWAQGDNAATINTTASPGTIITCEITGREVYWADQLRASTLNPAVTVRANRVENIPDDNLDLYLFIWSFNGTTNPATSTTWTMSFCSIEKFANMPVYIQGNRAQGSMNPQPTTIVGTPTVSFTQPALVAGTAAIGDVGIQYRANATGAASGAHLVSGATTNATVAKASAGRLLGWSLANTNAAWRYVKLHNQATTPTAGSGVVRTIGIPPNNTSQITFEGGIAFSTGIAFTTVTGAADADTTAVGANDIVGDLYYA